MAAASSTESFDVIATAQRQIGACYEEFDVQATSSAGIAFLGDGDVRGRLIGDPGCALDLGEFQ